MNVVRNFQSDAMPGHIYKSICTRRESSQRKGEEEFKINSKLGSFEI